jgi:DNA (cytosine-5)-methyltransferase 1
VRVVDLFAGCGGLTLGVAEAARSCGLGLDVRLAVDSDPDAIAVYRANLPTANVRLTRVEDLFDGRTGTPLTPVENAIRSGVGRVDVLVGGPPCQGHSDLNNHTRRDDPRNALYARMARAAEVLRPTVVLIENVPSVRHDVQNVVDATMTYLANFNYVVADAVIDTSALGAAQRRRRHVVLASIDKRIGVKKILESPSGQCPQHPVRSVRWAIADLGRSDSDDLFDSASVPSAENARRISWLFEHRAYDLPNSLRPPCHQSDHSYNSMYGRLRWDRPAQTVTTGFGSIGQGRYVHPSQRRTITPHEAARLQMLPDFWDFGVVKKRGALATLIGNAVPPVLATALLEPALKALSLAPADVVSEFSASGQRGAGQAGASRRRQTIREAAPPASSPAAHKRMHSTRRRDTKAEMAVRSALHGLGLRPQLDARVPGSRRRADMIFAESRVAVFVDGCFWHRCPIHSTSPKANAAWWDKKLAENHRRDEDTDRLLHQRGWTVLRFWEHEDPEKSAQTIAAIVLPGLGETVESTPEAVSEAARR